MNRNVAPPAAGRSLTRREALAARIAEDRRAADLRALHAAYVATVARWAPGLLPLMARRLRPGFRQP